jgi:CHAT domain-containing protein
MAVKTLWFCSWPPEGDPSRTTGTSYSRQVPAKASASSCRDSLSRSVRGSYMPIRGDGGVSAVLTAMAMVPLPGARAEAEAVAGRLQGAALLTGKDATKARLLKEGSDADVVHIAPHGFADPDFPDFSGVLLAGTDAEHPYDVFTAQEVYFWQLRARLVALSACQTALGKDVEGEGLLGLTRAFLCAGAKDVLCSLWPVSDDSTKVRMAWMYETLAKDIPVEEALQAAQKTLVGVEGTRHPFFWAGFIAVRGPQ